MFLFRREKRTGAGAPSQPLGESELYPERNLPPDLPVFFPMLGRLEKAYNRKVLGLETAERIAFAEATLAELPSRMLTEAWLDWFWALPPESWNDALAIPRAEGALDGVRWEAVRAITAKNRARKVDPSSERTAQAERRVASIREDLLALEAELKRLKEAANRIDSE